ncbi:beta-1,4-xylosyltransferase IRX9-like [Salvia miltiorrhiza]|uniref:beta-1,4-xylosyltransferase IRX9-like n=1 Tax=Salvia miltiorrhiza TaxID=226208 RepID=UPI0025ACC2D0|nr:beta-1,4-xylosyltransferase IRX9-like [Salvia miltiorrhiza]
MMMGSQERSRKKIHIWKKAILHFLLCFVMGFLTGFTPTRRSPSHVTMLLSSPQHVEHNHPFKRSAPVMNGEKLVIIVSPTSTRNKLLRNVLLTRLAHTLKLVAQPLLWVVVEPKSHDDHDPGVSQVLRKTGIMYRHLVCDEDLRDEDEQRNLALNHIEHHRLSGVVHFAGLANAYDLAFFQEIRAIEAFGAWPIAKMRANRKKVMIQGPVCDSSRVMGWHLKKMKNQTVEMPPPIHISSFAFNSSILWDPERWGRTFSTQDAAQNSVKYVKKEVVEEESTLKGIPTQGCSKVLLWELNIAIQL